MSQVEPFIADWDICGTLGEGAFSEVKLLVNSKTNERCACKWMNIAQYPQAVDTAKKEAMLLRSCDHKNIIHCYGKRIENDNCFVFLEYADGGELFDQIEPDVGMNIELAHFYFRQLITGVEYLHINGITHRDIKPENLLLSSQNVLKITDFGFATIFRHKGKERKFATRCGTKPYAAPEIFSGKEYRAEPIDIWSCGIVLVTLLAGQFAWDSPSLDCPEFADWKELRNLNNTPWSKIGIVAFSLLRNILHCNPDLRASIERIKQHRWFTKDYTKQRVHLSRLNSNGGPVPSNKRFKRTDEMNDQYYTDDVSQSQPVLDVSNLNDTNDNMEILEEDDCDENRKDNRTPTPNQSNLGSFSQPANMDSLLLQSQNDNQSQTQSQILNPLQMLVRRMTRFFVSVTPTDAIQAITTACIDTGCNVRSGSNTINPIQLTVSAVDRRKIPLSFKVFLYETPGKKLVDFRLSKGDGIEFKRVFVELKKKLIKIICKDNVQWLQEYGLVNNLPLASLSLTPPC